MIVNNNHIIQKQVLEVEMENPADAFQFKNLLSDVYHEKILPQLAVLFDEIATAGKLIRIEKLQIDIGNISSINWEATLTQKIISEVRQVLIKQHVATEKPIVTVTNKVNEKFVKTKSLQTHFKNKDDKAQPLPNTSNEWEDIFLFFLQTGRLPWFVTNNFQIKDLLQSRVFYEAIPNLHHFFKTAEPKVFERLLYQVNENILDEMIENLVANHPTIFLKNFIEAKPTLRGLTASFLLNKAISKTIVYLPFFLAFYNNENENFTSLYSNKFTKMLLEHSAAEPSKYASFLHKPPTKSNAIIKDIQLLIAAANTPILTDKDLLLLNQSAKQIEEPIIKKKTGLGQEEIYIENAGLVLLHPFLLPLFNELQLTVNNLFKDEYSSMKAVLFTQFLVNGLLEFEEHQLILNKILCGYPVDEPLCMQMEITQEERVEAAALLNQIILLWTQNNTRINGTIEGFQYSFLNRPGKLTNKGGDWQLQVEQRPYDMVLSSLPWGIGIIKTAWMKDMLWVDWA